MFDEYKVDRFGDSTGEVGRREVFVKNIRRMGYRPATKWELESLGPDKLFHAMYRGEQVGPVLVREEDR